jgi:26S proteasome regulatory subunit N1
VLFVCLGTNNARLATMLRQLAVYHAKDANNLFCVRIAQGLTHLSKGTLTLCPYHADRQIMSPVSVAGLLAFLVACLDVKNSKYWFLAAFYVSLGYQC